MTTTNTMREKTTNTTNARHRTPCILKAGKIYENDGGGWYRVLYAYANNRAIVENIKSHWRCECIGTAIYTDGKIDWDYSKGGYFHKYNL